MSRITDFFKTGIQLSPLPADVIVIGNMYGLDYSKSGANQVSIAAGICMDSTNGTMLTHSAASTVSIPTAINTIYNLFLQADGTIGVDTDVNGATLGTIRRWIGFVLTDSSGAIIDFTQSKNTLSMDRSATGIGTCTTGGTSLSTDSIVPATRIENIVFTGKRSDNTSSTIVSISGSLSETIGTFTAYAAINDSFTNAPISYETSFTFTGSTYSADIAVQSVTLLR